MSQSLGKVRHQDNTSAPIGRLQKVFAAEQRLSFIQPSAEAAA